jgi:hypothetical protein
VIRAGAGRSSQDCSRRPASSSPRPKRGHCLARASSAKKANCPGRPTPRRHRQVGGRTDIFSRPLQLTPEELHPSKLTRRSRYFEAARNLWMRLSAMRIDSMRTRALVQQVRDSHDPAAQRANSGCFVTLSAVRPFRIVGLLPSGGGLGWRLFERDRARVPDRPWPP